MNDLIKIKNAWCPDTAAPGTKHAGDGKPHGQCAVTALLVQDWYGGDLVRGVLADSGYPPVSHYWNRIPGMGDIDLTREQFMEGDSFHSIQVVPRSRLLEGDRAIAARTPERYARLKMRAEAGTV